MQRGCRKQLHSTRCFGNVTSRDRHMKLPWPIRRRASTEITVTIGRHVAVIFIYIVHLSLLFTAPCAAPLPSPLPEGGIKSAKLGTKSGHESYFGKCP